MLYSLLADLVVLLHFAFVLWAVLGGLFVLRWLGCIWLHLPAAVWAALIEFQGWICPLTHLESRLRQAAGQCHYDSGFVEHYLVPILYPAELSGGVQVILGLFVVVINLAIYIAVFKKRLASTTASSPIERSSPNR